MTKRRRGNFSHAPEKSTLVVAGIVGLDPTQDLFFFGTVSGGLGVLVMMCLTAVAVIRYFHRRRAGENLWRRRIAPTMAAIALVFIALVSVAFFGDLLGSTNPIKVWAAPVTYLAVAVVGVIWAYRLKKRRPAIYAFIGHGDRTAVTTAPSTRPAAPPEPCRDHRSPDPTRRHIAGTVH